MDTTTELPTFTDLCIEKLPHKISCPVCGPDATWNLNHKMLELAVFGSASAATVASLGLGFGGVLGALNEPKTSPQIEIICKGCCLTLHFSALQLGIIGTDGKKNFKD